MPKRTYGVTVQPALPRRGRAVTRRRGIPNWLLLSGAFVIFAIAAGTLLWLAVSYDRNEYAEAVQLSTSLADIANTSSQTPDIVLDETGSVQDGPQVSSLYSRDPIDRELNWEGILDINDGVKCWLYIPDMPIDYAVMEEPYSMDGSEYFYLRHNIYGEKESSGWIFSVKAPGDVEDMHGLIFGHNMGSGKEIMFGTLSRYKDAGFQETHPYIYLYYPDRTERWAVWSVGNIQSGDMMYNMPYEKGTTDYQSLLDWISSIAEYDTGVAQPKNTEYSLTLSTCDRGYAGTTGRFVVNAALDMIQYSDGRVLTAQEYYSER